VLNVNYTKFLIKFITVSYFQSNKNGNILLEKAINITLVSGRRNLGITERMVERCITRANTVGQYCTGVITRICGA
jgi:hypothetical protein